MTVMLNLGRTIRRLLQRRGFDLVRFDPSKPYRLRDKRASLRLLRELGFNPDVILDIGVADGTHGLYDTWLDAHYVLIEPLAKFEQALKAICQNCRSAEYHISAAGDAAHELTIAVHPTEPYHFLPSDKAPLNWTRTTIPVVTVDGILAAIRTNRRIRQAILKIDVDGGELAVLRGSNSLLALDAVVIIEAALLADAGFGQIIEFMRSSGYECFDIIESLYRFDDVLWQVDLVFVRSESKFRSNRMGEILSLPLESRFKSYGSSRNRAGEFGV
jgi:FkbM family methyltransferase